MRTNESGPLWLLMPLKISPCWAVSSRHMWSWNFYYSHPGSSPDLIIIMTIHQASLIVLLAAFSLENNKFLHQHSLYWIKRSNSSLHNTPLAQYWAQTWQPGRRVKLSVLNKYVAITEEICQIWTLGVVVNSCHQWDLIRDIWGHEAEGFKRVLISGIPACGKLRKFNFVKTLHFCLF